MHDLVWQEKLPEKSSNDEHERRILSRLKQQCGTQFTSKVGCGFDCSFFFVAIVAADTSSSNKHERSILSRLKQQCSAQLTSKVGAIVAVSMRLS